MHNNKVEVLIAFSTAVTITDKETFPEILQIYNNRDIALTTSDTLDSTSNEDATLDISTISISLYYWAEAIIDLSTITKIIKAPNSEYFVYTEDAGSPLKVKVGKDVDLYKIFKEYNSVFRSYN